MQPYRVCYTAYQQAKLWKKSRCNLEVEEAAKAMIKEGAGNIANLIRTTVVLPGKRETDFLPGQSWHQYGEAMDVRLVSPEGKVVWAPGHHGYETFARIARDEGLTAGYYWKRKDANHVQLRDQTVRSIYSWKEIDEIVAKEMSRNQLRA